MCSYKLFDHKTERRKWQDPEAILFSLGIRLGFTFVDIGCSDGFFALPAARLVGEKGRVYGLDIDEQAIDRLNKRAIEEGLTNLILKVGEAEETVLCDSCADVVFFGIVLHDFRSVSKVLLNARRMLKPNGSLVDLDWKKKPMGFGPPLHIRFSEREAASLIEGAGFKIETIRRSELYHYVIIARQ